MALLPFKLGALLFIAIQFVVFLFVTVSTPISQFSVDNGWGGGCFTLWGYKRSCHSNSYTSKNTLAFGCTKRRDIMNAAAAFAIFAVFTTLVAFIIAIVYMFLKRAKCKLIAKILIIFYTILSMLNILVVWACVASVYNNSMCTGSRKYSIKTLASFDAGFGLMVAAWCLELINIVVLLLWIL